MTRTSLVDNGQQRVLLSVMGLDSFPRVFDTTGPCLPERLPLLPGGRLATMIDDLAKDFLHGRLKTIREVLVWKLDALSEYDIRRRLTATGTNLLGLVKHMATCEAWYFGEVFGRPSPEPLGRWQDADGSDLWVTPDETREQILDFYQRAWRHADATIGELPIDAPGHVPWWSPPDVTLFGVMIHVLQETTRHAGHADILREQLDGRTGLRAEYAEEIDTAARAAHRATIEQAAQAAAGGAGTPA
jgi:uncharacterized damage-inducible protein DinB